jgi:LPXTG-motif cell wall-anchored protein
MAIAIFIIGMGIGLKIGDSEINTTLLTVIGLALSAIGLLVLASVNKKKMKSINRSHHLAFIISKT